MKTLWLRSETLDDERRTPLVPEDAEKLVQAGISVVVEKSNDRVFQDNEYQKVGCELVDSQSWIYANSQNTVILGLKPCYPLPEKLKHTHIFFAHAYKNQPDSKEILSAFLQGGGHLYDLEYLVDGDQKRIATFNFYAGYCAAALAVIKWVDLYQKKEIQTPIKSFNSIDELTKHIVEKKQVMPLQPNLLILGDGQCSIGVTDFLENFGFQFTQLSSKDLKNKAESLFIPSCDVVINAFRTREKRCEKVLSVSNFEYSGAKLLVDLICEPFSPYNALPEYRQLTTFKEPMLKMQLINNTMYLIAIQNFASFLPKESSLAFSLPLLKTLIDLFKGNKTDTFHHASACFSKAIEGLKL
ncbi:MAG: hypothetical protein HKM04_10980 [Legionellales bacterium]|nr:hypothetical protein [Legionellales bacterium]